MNRSELNFSFLIFGYRLNKNEMKQKRKIKDEIKSKLVRSLLEFDVFENEELA